MSSGISETHSRVTASSPEPAHFFTISPVPAQQMCPCTVWSTCFSVFCYSCVSCPLSGHSVTASLNNLPCPASHNISLILRPVVFCFLPPVRWNHNYHVHCLFPCPPLYTHLNRPCLLLFNPCCLVSYVLLWYTGRGSWILFLCSSVWFGSGTHALPGTLPGAAWFGLGTPTLPRAGCAPPYTTGLRKLYNQRHRTLSSHRFGLPSRAPELEIMAKPAPG